MIETGTWLCVVELEEDWGSVLACLPYDARVDSRARQAPHSDDDGGHQIQHDASMTRLPRMKKEFDWLMKHALRS